MIDWIAVFFTRRCFIFGSLVMGLLMTGHAFAIDPACAPLKEEGLLPPRAEEPVAAQPKDMVDLSSVRDPYLHAIGKNARGIYHDLRRRAALEGINVRVPAQDHFMGQVMEDLSNNIAALTLALSQGRHPWARRHLPLVKSLFEEAKALRVAQNPYGKMVDFVFRYASEMDTVDKLARTRADRSRFTLFHSSYGPQRVEEMLGYFPDVFLFFSFEAVSQMFLNDLRGTPMRLTWFVANPYYLDQHWLSLKEVPFHDAGHGWAQYISDLDFAAKYDLPKEQVLEMFGAVNEHLKERLRALKKSGSPLWRAAHEFLFELGHERNFPDDYYALLNQSSHPMYVNDIIWKHANKWYDQNPLTAEQLALLPRAREWLHREMRKLTEDWAMDLSREYGAWEKPLKLLRKPLGFYGRGANPVIIVKTAHDVRAKFPNTDESRLARIWQISLIGLHPDPSQALEPMTLERIAKALSLKEHGRSIQQLAGRSGSFEVEELEIRSRSDVKVVLIDQGTGERLKVDIGDIKWDMQFEAPPKPIDNYDHFKIDLILSRITTAYEYQYFMEADPIPLEGRFVRVTTDDKGVKFVDIKSSDGTIGTHPLSEITPAALWKDAGAVSGPQPY